MSSMIFAQLFRIKETPFTTPECIAYGVGCFCAPIQRKVWWCASLADTGNDVTALYSKWLTENKRAITAVITNLEFSYLYNGILQHSDTSLSKRYLSDYASVELNYLLWKHVRVLGFIKSLLGPYYKMMNVLTFPKLGPL